MEEGHPIVQLFLPTEVFLNNGSRKSVKVDNQHHHRFLTLLGSSKWSETHGALQIVVSAIHQSKQNHHCSHCGQLTVGNLVFDDETMPQAPVWASSTESPAVFVSLRVWRSIRKIRVEQIVVDGLILSPDPDSLMIFYYPPLELRRARHLRTLSEEDSGLVDVVKNLYEEPQTVTSFGSDCEELFHIPPVNEDAHDFEEEDDLIIGQEESKDDPLPNLSVPQKKALSLSENLAIFERSMGVRQLLEKLGTLKYIIDQRRCTLVILNLLALTVVDTVLGCCFSHILYGFPYLYSTLHSQIHYLLAVVLKLLNWLRGAPAGLKLNNALNSLLWRFFSYHLHLWVNYIGILEPILSFILSTIMLVGPVGITFQIALVKDLLSIATFHVYCLYIYATRLYRVLTIAVISLARLFLGRKWNPLRNRVDHVHLTISEMFLGTMFFTIAIFLTPTIAIYYFVFLTLRFPVLFVEFCLSSLIDMFSHLRFASMYFALSNNPTVADQIYLENIGNVPVPQYQIHLHSPGYFSSLLYVPTLCTPRIIGDIVRGHVLTSVNGI